MAGWPRPDEWITRRHRVGRHAAASMDADPTGQVRRALYAAHRSNRPDGRYQDAAVSAGGQYGPRHLLRENGDSEPTRRAAASSRYPDGRSTGEDRNGAGATL